MRFSLILIGLLLSISGFNQSLKPDFITFSPKGGFLIAHRPFMDHLVRENSAAYEIAMWHQFKDTTYHTLRHKMPLWGLSIEYRNFGYHEVLGEAISSTGYMVFPLTHIGKNTFFDLTIGTGIGYLTKCYNQNENPLNNAIGSKLNARVNLKFSVLHYFKKLHIGAGIEFMHFSNGALKTPNLGLNLPSVYAQLGYNFKDRILQTKTDVDKNSFESKKKHALNTELIFTGKEIGAIPYQPKLYPVIGSRISYTYLKRDFWGFEIASDIIHNEANFHKYVDTTFTRKDILQIGIYAGAFIRFYKSELAFGAGYYIRDNINPEGRMYNRVGYRFFLYQNLFCLFNIKANFAKADYFEFGIGYRFNQLCKKQL